ncbi:MAG: hypothetical protein R2939_11350 [Kofleriaceae bacterium]
MGCGAPAERPIDAAPPDAPASCIAATQHSDLRWIEDNIFDRSCVFSSCHEGSAQSAGGLNLEPGEAHASLVNQPSGLFPDWDLVVPGDPARSYLLVITGHRPGPINTDIGNMPYDNQLLCVEKREALERWIAGGALGAPDARPPDADLPDADLPDAEPADAAT